MTPFKIQLLIDKKIDVAMAGDILLAMDLFDVNGSVKVLFVDKEGRFNWIHLHECKFIQFIDPVETQLCKTANPVSVSQEGFDNFLENAPAGNSNSDEVPVEPVSDINPEPSETESKKKSK